MSTIVTTIDPERQMLGELEMVGRERWEEIHRRASSGDSIRAIAGALDLDRKTVRRCLRQTAWTPYERAARSDTLLTTHAEYLRRRPPGGCPGRCWNSAAARVRFYATCSTFVASPRPRR